MRRELLTRWLGPLALAALIPLGMSACSQADRDRAQERTDDLAGQAGNAGQQIGGAIEDLGAEARQSVEQAAEEVRDGSEEVREAAARNGVALVVEGEFRRHGVELDGVPACSATSPAIGQYHVECAGQTKDGRAFALVGDDPGDPPANFVGTVDGQEIFRQECVGLC
jgi:hypothetical protein